MSNSVAKMSGRLMNRTKHVIYACMSRMNPRNMPSVMDGINSL